MSKRRRRVSLQAVGIGLAATLGVLVLYALGGLDWLELKTLDLRFRYASSVPEDPRLVCVDIDDESLAIVGRWPWSRDVQAGLISVLFESGLQALLCDIEFGDPETLRSVMPPQADVAVNRFDLRPEDAPLAFPDDELRLAIADAGGVYLAFHYEHARDRASDPNGLAGRLETWLDAHPAAAQEPAHALFETVYADVAHSDPRQVEATALALRNVLSRMATMERPFLPLGAVAAATRPVPAIAPVYFEHARAAKRCGFVVFEPDVDGVVRRMRLLVTYDGHVLPQLAFAVAFDELELKPADVSADAHTLTLRSPRLSDPLAIQLDDDGRALVPWVAKGDWTQQFGEHVPADAVWQVFDRRQKVRQNRELVRDTLATLVATGRHDDWKTIHDDLKRRLELDGELRAARYRNDTSSATDTRGWIGEYDTLLADETRTLREQLEALVAAQPAVREDGPLVDTLRRAFAANDEYEREIDETLAWLRERVRGKIGLLGYTATALADMTPIPTQPRAPGVVAHANLLNGLLNGRMVFWAPQWLNLLLAGLMGVLATVMSARWGPRVAGGVALLAIAYLAVAGWVAFYAWGYWIALTPAVGALVLSYGTIVVYRYLFLERESRHIARALSQYTTPTLARQMADDAELCKRAETREVTAVFTDLAGFTTISERIGAQRTQHVLNIAFGRFCDVMIHYEGMINKFIGDGIFAFWNPVIYPQDDHARRACATAVDLQAALRKLAAERDAEDTTFQELYLRIGVATGNAVVGPCGSEQKYDYTCIGDSVNVAARLESANKFYGTRTLVSGTTREQAGDEFAYRWLGGVQVKGKTQAVQIYELLGRAGQVDDETLQCAACFARGVEAFQRREWGAARDAFQTCLSRCATDRAGRVYLRAIEQFEATPPPEGWNGAIELTEK